MKLEEFTVISRKQVKGKAVIFDLDGTLWDATGCTPEIWNRILKKHNMKGFQMSRERVSALMGMTMEEIGDVLFPDLPSAGRKRIVDEYGEEEVRYLLKNGAELYYRTRETIESLTEQYDLYIVSNSQDGYVQAFLQAHGLAAYFRDFEMSGRTGMEKGENILLLMERNNITDAVYIGDTEKDETAARYAGIPFIFAKYGFGKAVCPDAVIESIAELPETLRDFYHQ